MAKAREISDLESTMPFRQAAAKAVAARSEEVFLHATGVLDIDDIERVHDMRVATRRLRAVMEIFAPCFPKREHKLALREVKDLADALGERRDPDVAIAALEQVASSLTAADRPGLESLIAELRDRQEHGNASLERKLEQVRQSGLEQRLRALAADAGSEGG